MFHLPISQDLLVYHFFAGVPAVRMSPACECSHPRAVHAEGNKLIQIWWSFDRLFYRLGRPHKDQSVVVQLHFINETTAKEIVLMPLCCSGYWLKISTSQQIVLNHNAVTGTHCGTIYYIVLLRPSKYFRFRTVALPYPKKLNQLISANKNNSRIYTNVCSSSHAGLKQMHVLIMVAFAWRGVATMCHRR